MCEIIPTQIFGVVSDDGGIASLVVDGTVAACNQLEVRIEHTGNGSSTVAKVVTANAAGQWRARFESAAFEYEARDFACGDIDTGSLRATAVCVTDSGCTGVEDFKTLPCGAEPPPLPTPPPQPVQTCPSTSMSPPSIADECVDGLRQVVVSGEVTPAPDTSISARIGLYNASGDVITVLDEAFDRSDAFALGGAATALQLAPGSYEARLEITQPNYCGNNIEAVVVPPCPGRPGGPPPPPPGPQPQPEGPNSGAINACWVWFWVNIGLFTTVAVLAVVTTCLIEAEVWAILGTIGSAGTLGAAWALLSLANKILLVLTLALLLGTLVSFGLWLWRCAFGSMRDIVCEVLALLMTVLAALEVAAMVLVVVLGLMSMWGCAAGALFDVAWFGLLMSITRFCELLAGCVSWPWWSPLRATNARGRAERGL